MRVNRQILLVSRPDPATGPSEANFALRKAPMPEAGNGEALPETSDFEKTKHHIAFELKGNASHAMAADTLREAGVSTKWGPARHTAGHNLAGYHFDPENTLIELFSVMGQFVAQQNMCEPRPCHEHYPM